MTSADFAQFLKLVLDDENLQAELRDIRDRGEFVDRVVALGAASAFTFTHDDVEEAIRTGRQAWIDAIYEHVG